MKPPKTPHMPPSRAPRSPAVVAKPPETPAMPLSHAAHSVAVVASPFMPTAVTEILGRGGDASFPNVL